MVSFEDLLGQKEKICVVGLGYVGLPLAVALAKKFSVIGFDLNEQRIAELSEGVDRTRELTAEQLRESKMAFSSDMAVLGQAKFIIVTVPTPIDKHKKPDLSPLLAASEAIGQYGQPDSVIVYESTVYPGATEEKCIPAIEAQSRLVWKKDFAVGYSPERINPGDKEHTVEKITKVVAGDSAESLAVIAAVYGAVITAGIHEAPSIKVAEAAKVIENCQRDINIAFVNELAMIFEKMGIDTQEVLAAAGTKWNFLPFKPGLVGGHCIGVDPYYLTHKALELGYKPDVILAGRRINDGMGAYVANRVVRLMIDQDCKIKGAKVLMLGIAFKENCPDIRNSRAVDIYRELVEFGVDVRVYDPLCSTEEVEREYGFGLLKELGGDYDGIVLAVNHKEFEELDLGRLGLGHTVVFDVKSCLDKRSVSGRL